MSLLSQKGSAYDIDKECKQAFRTGKFYYLTFMNEKEIKAQIEDEIQKTESLIEEYRELTKPESPDAAIDDHERMDAINNRSINEAALRQAEEKYKKLNYVLTKIGTPEFGVCMQCGQPIPIERILIRPESSHCVNCAR